MINYLRNNGTYEPKFESRSEEMLFLKELEFWEISTKHPFGTIKQETELTDRLPERLVALMKSEPKVKEEALYRWKSLGPI